MLRSLAASAALVVAVAACGSAALPTTIPSIDIPTFPPDDIASGTAACVDAPTMAVLDELRAAGADVPSLLAANKDALITGLGDLESSDPNTTAWRDSLVGALRSGDFDAAADEIARLSNDEVTITPC